MNTAPTNNEDVSQAAAQTTPIIPKTASEALRPEAGTPPPAKRSRASRSQIIVFMNFLVSCVMLAVIAAGGAVYFGRQEFFGQGPSANGDTFLVKPNSGVQDIADQLERRGLISDARVFRLGVRAYGNDQRSRLVSTRSSHVPRCARSWIF